MPSSTLAISDQDRATLASWTRSSTVPAGQRERALIVLSVAQGIGVSGTARALGVSRPTVIKWRERFTADGIDGLADLARSGRPKTIDDAQIELLITGGVTGSSMSAWSQDFGGSLTSEQIREIATFLRSLEAKAPSVPDWRTGAKATG